MKHQTLGKGSNKVIVLHDWSQDMSSNDAIKPYLNQDKFTFAFADLRGYGASKKEAGEFTLEEVVRDLTKLANILKWSEFSLVGHSMCGMVAQKAMIAIPERLQKVVLTTPVPASGVPVDDATYKFFLNMTTDNDAFKQGMHGLTSARYGEEWAQFKLSKNRETVNPEAMKAYCTMWVKSDFSKELRAISTPVLAIFGKHDSEGLRSEALTPQFKDWFANFKSYVCDCGHYPMQETPVDYAHTMQNFLGN